VVLDPDGWVLKQIVSPPVAVEETGQAGEFRLEQNYPNPFNPTTRIVYRVDGRQSVQLKVYDLLGREVATLVHETKPPGEYSVSFDAEGLASGVYVYRLSLGGRVLSRRMVLVR
jgi:hypothetical protein